MQYTSGLRERVEAMPSEELAGVLAVDPHRYQREFLELARRELERRGFVFSGRGGVITTRDGLTLIPRPPALAPAPRQGPSGVGGWLLIFVLSNLACRPLTALGGGVGNSAASIAQVAQFYPTTAFLLNVDKMLTFGLIFFGAVVSLALLHKGSSLPVKIAKVFLAVYPAVCMLMAALYGFNDLPEDYGDSLVQGSMRQAVAASAWSLIWILYFNRSRRVKATYYADEYTSGGDSGGGATITSLGLRQ